MNDVETARSLSRILPGGLTVRAAVGIVVGLTALRVATLYLAETNLSVDEAQYWVWSQELAFGYYSKPPLLAWIIRLTTEIFGNSEAAARLASPLLHGATALVLMRLARRLYDERIAAWTAVLWVTFPALSLSATLISTDVPLMLAWSAALLCLFELIERPRWQTAVLLGLAIGLGLNAKYAMVYFPPCVLAMAVAIRSDRWLLKSPHLWLAFAVALVLIAPNIAWNASHDFATFDHLRDNVGWRVVDLFHPDRAIEFFAAQFAVFGPFAFAALLVVLWGAVRNGTGTTEERLLWLSVPVIAAITVQAFLSKAYANWAATAYPAASILVTVALLDRRWMRPTLAFNLSVVAIFLISPIFARNLMEMSEWRPYKRLLGYSELADEVRERAARAGADTVVTTRRYEAAELIYYLRDTGIEIRMLHPPGAVPRDHFALTRPWWYGNGDSVGALVLIAGPGPAAGNPDGVSSPIEWHEPFAVSPGVDGSGMMRTGLIRREPGVR